MADEVRTISINVQATRAIQSLTKMSISLDEMTAAVGSSDANLKKIDRTMAASQKTAFAAAQTLAKLKTEYKLLGKELTVSNNSIKALEGRLATANKRLAQQKVINEDLRKANKALTRDNNDLAKSNEKIAASFGKVATGANSTKKAVKELNDSFQENALRYVMYDLANVFRQVRDVGVKSLGDLLKTGIAFEKGFANVIRTSQVSNPDLFADTGAATEALREQFLDLQSSLPVTTEELARIGTLAAQMGVAASEVANFTEVTAKFAATSGISAEEAATALSRIGQMLSGDVQGNYERLASAILKTGVNAIATEQQIVRGTTQIASVGKVAGFSAQEIIALSSAMSSLGMSPELQRSIVTSSFTKILTAVRGSTEEAEKFGRVLGLTGQEFQKAWEGDGYNTYRKLLAAIAQSPNAIGLLKDLGLASQRLTPNLLKMGQAYDLLGDTLEDTNKGWSESTELQRQYDEIAKTTAARLQVLSQAWDAFLTIIGADAVNTLGDLAKWLTEVLKHLQDFGRTEVGTVVSNLVLIVAALGTALFALMTALTLSVAGLLAFDFAQRQLTASTAGAAGALAGQTAIMRGFSIASGAAALSLKGLNLALTALGKATPFLAALAIPLAIGADSGLSDWATQISGIETDIKGLSDMLKKGGANGLGGGFAEVFNEDNFDWKRAMGGGSLSSGPFAQIKSLDEKLAEFAKGSPKEAVTALEDLRASYLKYDGHTNEGFNKLFTDTNDVLALTAQGVGVARDDLEEYYHGVEESSTAEEEQAIRLAETAAALGLVSNEYASAEDSLKSFTDAISSGMGGFFEFGDLLSDAYGDDEGQGGGLARLQKDLDENLSAASNWASGLQTLIAQGATSLAQAFAEQGPESQQAVTDALALGPDALARLESSMAFAAFLASDAYASAFATDSANLAEVYKKVLGTGGADAARQAFDEARAAMISDGGLTASEALAIEQKYGIKLNIDLIPTVNPQEYDNELLNAQAAANARPVTIPLKMGEPGAPWGDTTGTGWTVFENGHSITLKVHPETEEGQAALNEWRAAEYETPVRMKTVVDTTGANADLNAWLAKVNQTSVIQVKIRTTGGAIDPGGNLYPGKTPTSATGSLVHNGQLVRNNYPGFAGGGVLRGPGTGTSDSILARVSNGEAITRAAAVRHYGSSFFEDLNRMRIPKYATGGIVGSSGGGGGGTIVNATVVQNYPTSQDPIKKLKEDAESVIAGIWT